MPYTNENLCVECNEHVSDAHQPDCSSFDLERFLPLTEQEVRELIGKQLRRRASEACYWKEEFENKNMAESAEYWKVIEAVWNESADIALGLRKA
jgi:hypothetical protein